MAAWQYCSCRPMRKAGAGDTGTASGIAKSCCRVRCLLQRGPCRRGGVYVVIGGAGGIGEVWSEHMIRAYQAQIVWIGRRPLDAAIRSKLDRLAKLGPAPLYIEVDATDRWALERAYARIKQAHAQVHGVIHSAAVVRDGSLAKIEEAAFSAVLSAKVDVSVRLAQVFCEDQLDFVLFFSSLQSFNRGHGLSNYAAGCTFEDAFALALGRIWPCPVKVMNWGYWGSIGIGKGYETRMARAGLGAIEAEEGHGRVGSDACRAPEPDLAGEDHEAVRNGRCLSRTASYPSGRACVNLYRAAGRSGVACTGSTARGTCRSGRRGGAGGKVAMDATDCCRLSDKRQAEHRDNQGCARPGRLIRPMAGREPRHPGGARLHRAGW